MHVSNPIVLNHLDRMTDSTGLIQHAIYSIPRRESGYTTDDNARALRLCTRLWEQQPGERMLGRVTTYLSFLEHARCPVRGFHNFLSYQRDWLDAEGTGDSQGQAVRALAEVLGSSLPGGYRAFARVDRHGYARVGRSTESAGTGIRDLAWGHLSMSGVKDLESVENVAWSAAQRLVECYRRSLRPDWPWFESRMTYANAVLPHALFIAARCWPEEDFLDVAEATFDFLDRETTVENVFWPIGNSDWYPVEKNNRCTISNRSKLSQWQKPRWLDSRCWAIRAVKNTWLRSVARTLGFMARIASINRLSMFTVAPAMTVCNGRA